MLNNSRIEQLKQLLEAEPEDLFLHYALGMEFLNDAQCLHIADEKFKKVLQLNGDYIAAYYQLGKLSEQQLRNKEALEFYKTGLEKAKQQKNNKAVNEFSEAIFMLEE